MYKLPGRVGFASDPFVHGIVLFASQLLARELCRTAEQGVRGCREEDVASFRRTRRLHYASEAAAMEL
jgi:hypothetical protein